MYQIINVQRFIYGMKAKIVRYGSANDIDIKFSNGTIVMHKTYANFCSGSVACK